MHNNILTYWLRLFIGWLTGFVLTSSANGSTTGSATGSAAILAVDLNHVLAIGLGPKTSGGVVSIIILSKDASIVISYGCGVHGINISIVSETTTISLLLS